jgi:large subunit ribosomal protein L9
MQIILLEKVVNVGDLGDIVKVKQGYARNYLIPQGKAKRATPDNIKLIEAKRAELETAAAQRLTAAQEQAAKIEGLSIKITQKAGVDGRLFGSVTNVDIVEAMTAQGITLEKGAIRMPEGPLKHIGEFPLVVALYLDVTANITVTVLAAPCAGSALSKWPRCRRPVPVPTL